MAQQPLNTYRTVTGIVSTSNEEIYRTKTGYTSIVLYAQVANTASGIGTITFYHQRESRSQSGVTTSQTEIIKDAVVIPNDALVLLDGRLVLERTALKTDSIRLVGIGTTNPVGYQTNQTHMKYTVSILETLNQ
jgi:hypothetical protein